jgi:hypothetical protein
MEDVHSVTIKIIKYTVFGPEEFPYFYFSPADKEAPEILNNKLPFPHQKYLQTDICSFGTSVRINRFCYTRCVLSVYTHCVSKYCNMYHNLLITRREILFITHIYFARRSVFLVPPDKQGSSQWNFPYPASLQWAADVRVDSLLELSR